MNQTSPVPNEVKKIESDRELPKVLPKEVRITPEDKQDELFDFPMAMQKVGEGKKISKKEWNSRDEYGILHKARLTLHKKEGTNHDWLLSEGDIMGKDWFVVE